MLGKKRPQSGPDEFQNTKPQLGCKTMPSTNASLENLLSRVFDEAQDGLLQEVDAETYERIKREFLFHMTDWTIDLTDLASLYQHPDSADLSGACRVVIGFLYHVIPHLKAAGRLLLDEIPDAFTDQDKNGSQCPL